MINQHIFINIIIVLQIGAVINYLYFRDWGLFLYWLGCVLINITVTYVIPAK